MAELDNTAERTALWRALHLIIDAKPFVFEDNWALKLADPSPDWQQRPDMRFTRSIRASIVGRARLVEDQVLDCIHSGVTQYVILGAGLDSFALRHPELRTQVQVYEIDQTTTLKWKQQRIDAHTVLPENLHFIPVDFEKTNWWQALQLSEFDFSRKTVISCTGVTLYLSKEAVLEMLRLINKLITGSTAIISFYAPLEDLEGEDKQLMATSIKGAAASGTPMVSFFNSHEILEIAAVAGLKKYRTLNTKDLNTQYFDGRPDALKPSDGEIFLVANT